MDGVFSEKRQMDTHVTAPDINGVEIWGWVVDDYLTGVEPKNNQINSFSADVG